MRILLQSRQTLFSVPGGDTTQIIKTAEALRMLDCQVDINLELEPDLSNYDLVHIFNLTRPQETYLQAKNAKQQRKPVVLSTIYVDYSESDRLLRTGLAGFVSKTLPSNIVAYFKVVLRIFTNLEINKGSLYLILHGYRTLQKKLIEFSDVLMPNSNSERTRLAQDFGEIIFRKKYVIVPNGIDTKIFNLSSINNDDRDLLYKGYVLCVARIEKLKNQLNLVKAMNELPWELTLIGKPAPNHKGYFNEVKKYCSKYIKILGQVQHSSLPSYYLSARVHVLPSWMETTGLSTLEAGAMGCNIVITDKGDTREIFGDYAFYCDPGEIDSIHNAIIDAYNAPYPNLKLSQYIHENYTWDIAAERTLEGYNKTISALILNKNL